MSAGHVKGNFLVLYAKPPYHTRSYKEKLLFRLEDIISAPKGNEDSKLFLSNTY